MNTIQILAAGLSPAWQQIVRLESLRPGEVNRAREVRWCASGKVLNVGLALTLMCRGGESLAGLAAEPGTVVGSEDVLTLALAGGMAAGQMQAEFERLGATARWIPAVEETRVCTTLLDETAGVTTEIVENARPTSAAELDAFQTAFVDAAQAAQVVVLTGSFPPGTPPGYFSQLMALTPARVIVDAQGPPLWAALESQPFLIKPNREELGRTLGRPVSTDEQLREAVAECHRLGARWIVISNGPAEVWVASPDRLVRLRPPKVSVVNPIGSGDCLAAGLAWGLAAGWDVPTAARLGVAAAADNVGRLLPARIDPGRIAGLFHRVTVD